MHVEYLDHLPEEFRLPAARLFIDALRGKLAPILGTDLKAHQLVADNLATNRCHIALCDHKLVGILGIQAGKDSFLNLTLKSLTQEHGFWGGLLRFGGLFLLHHKAEPGEWYIDGIAVAEEMRGRGIGSALLERVEKKAKRGGIKRLMLEVVDSNQKAKLLYKRLGFSEACTSNLWPFNRLFGFSFQYATQMVKCLPANLATTDCKEN